MANSAAALPLTESQKAELEALVHNGNTSQKMAQRGRLVLLAHQGVANRVIAQQLQVSRPTVLALRAAFANNGMAAVTAARKRKRQPKVLTAEVEQRILDATLKTRPGDGSTHWSVRMMAKHMGVSRTIVHRVWQKHDVQPHRVERFKLSKDPKLEEKVRDIVGLYLNPPDRALVLSVDEKTQIQALDRTAPILPLRPGLPQRQTHDYQRHGTTTLFAAFNILNGKVIGSCRPRHRSQEFIRFLHQLEREIPPDQDVHLVMDKYSTHKSAAVQRWLKPKKRRRFHFHFTPTSSSWLNQVERLFGLITDKMIRRGTFHCVDELEHAIYQWLVNWNNEPRPFVWKATADVILDKIRRCREAVAKR